MGRQPRNAASQPMPEVTLPAAICAAFGRQCEVLLRAGQFHRLAEVGRAAQAEWLRLSSRPPLEEPLLEAAERLGLQTFHLQAAVDRGGPATLGELSQWSDAELRQLPGFGPQQLRALRSACDEARRQAK